MRRSLLFLAAWGASCADEPIEPARHAPAACETAGVLPGPAPVRRMTRFEYDRTVRDLLGDTTSPAADFGPEEEALGFNNNAANLYTSPLLAEKYMLAAEGIAERATEPPSALTACNVAALTEEGCARVFIASFGKRAYRRPLTTAESEMLLELYAVGRAAADHRLGIRLVIEGALQSAPFLYRLEVGLPEDEGEAAVRLGHWEMASRLSYFLWGTMPDDELFAAAGAGELGTAEEVAAQARRMLDDPRARAAITEFHAQWLDYGRIAAVGKDASLFPTWSADVGELMRRETEAFVEHVVFEDDGDLGALLTAPYSFMNGELAAFYGVASGPQGDALARVELDPGQRAGLLTQGSLLSINAHSNQTSPVHRGKLVRERLLCDVMPPPPPDVNITPPDPAPGATARERFAEHSKNPACSGCHQLMDPLGFGFEGYDAVGRHRETEEGEPIDASGVVTESDVDGPFDGAVGLAAKLAASRDVQRCYVKQWFRYGHGRGETDEDACSTAALEASFEASGGDIKELLVALTQTDAFLYRRPGAAP